ncbi:hypothetical protein IAT38_007300 [Cryptococcus sp. DSM 104549]
MPAVLLTGITGFLSAHVALVFLKNNWTVHGTLRNSSKEASVKAVPEYAPYIASGHLKLFVTGSLENGDYSEAIKGVDAVVHTASPVEFGGEEFRESHLKPALQGTTSVLEAADREKSVKAVVYTSTYGAVGDHKGHPTEQKGRTIDENDWNPYTLEELDKMVETGESGNPSFPSGFLFYKGSKKYAELAAWDVQRAAQKKGSTWSLAAMNCVMIWGPPIQPLTSLSHGGMSTEFLWMLAGGKDTQVMETLYPYYVDVRDAAEAHYQAVIRKAQGRFLLSAGPYDFNEFCDMLRELYPEQAERFATGSHKYMYKDPGVYDLSNEKSKKELGIQYRPKEVTLKDAFDRFFELEKQGLK